MAEKWTVDMVDNIRIKYGLFFLLRQGLWGINNIEDAKKYFPMSAEEWQNIYIHSCRQAVQGMVYDGILLLPESFFPPRSLFLQWTADIDQWERINKQQIHVLSAINRFFAIEPTISFEVIKGLAISCYYSNPLHRICGDIDLYFGSPSSVHQAAKKLESSGVYVKYGANDDASCLIDQVIIELHPKLIELHNPLICKTLRDWERNIFCSVISKLKPVYQDIPISVPIPEAHHILVSTHILKHLLAEGVGLRQLCDAAILLKGLHKETDKTELERLCRKFGIYKWSCLLYSFLSEHLGLPEEYLPFIKHYPTEDLFTEVWESGNMGFYDSRKGERPQGKWKNKIYTVKQISRKGKLFLKYAPAETFWWPALLTIRRIKEIFVGNERTAEEDNK